MGVRKAIGRSVKSKFNVKKWAGAEQVVENAHLIKDIAKDVFEKDKQDTRTFHTFADAARFYGLSEAELKKRRKNSFFMALGFLVLMLLLIAYSIYLLTAPLILAGLTAVMLSAVAGLLAFKEHFTFYQLTTRRLKSSIHDWFAFLCSKQGRSL